MHTPCLVRYHSRPQPKLNAYVQPSASVCELRAGLHASSHSHSGPGSSTCGQSRRLILGMRAVHRHTRGTLPARPGKRAHTPPHKPQQQSPAPSSLRRALAPPRLPPAPSIHRQHHPTVASASFEGPENACSRVHAFDTSFTCCRHSVRPSPRERARRGPPYLNRPCVGVGKHQELGGPAQNRRAASLILVHQ